MLIVLGLLSAACAAWMSVVTVRWSRTPKRRPAALFPALWACACFCYAAYFLTGATLGWLTVVGNVLVVVLFSVVILATFVDAVIDMRGGKGYDGLSSALVGIGLLLILLYAALSWHTAVAGLIAIALAVVASAKADRLEKRKKLEAHKRRLGLLDESVDKSDNSETARLTRIREANKSPERIIER